MSGVPGALAVVTRRTISWEALNKPHPRRISW
ncbi:chloramphenicol resistance leader peptide [Pseudomonas aeruginosa]|nr:chloramphenicol resistance leader peptide [Pseudomonas aeruginosa]